jgi:eukaryotic-like serine/threonine-protein kinase
MTAGNARRDELIGRVLAGKYRLERLIAEGGMGAVYEARHVELGSRVAVKVIDRECLTSTEHMRRFRREARAASAAESEGIVRVYDIGEDASVGLYMVMELLSGEDLERRLARDHRLPVETALDIALQAARALAKAHAAGVVHRDLKPANIFLTPLEDGGIRVKVVDFGISKLLDDQVPSSGGNATTKFGTLIGTPQYMSPEQAEGKSVDARTDVWSLGAVLYEMLSGRPLVDGSGHYHAVLLRILLESPMPLATVAPHVPPRLVAVVERALARDATHRHADGRALAADLAVVVAELRGRPSPVIGINAFAATSPAFGPRLPSPAPASAPTLPPTTMAIAPMAPPVPTGPSAVTMRAMMSGGIGLAPIAAALAALAFFVVLAFSMLRSDGRQERRSSASTATTLAPPAATEVAPSFPPVTTPSALPDALPEARDAGASSGRARARPSGAAPAR